MHQEYNWYWTWGHLTGTCEGTLWFWTFGLSECFRETKTLSGVSSPPTASSLMLGDSVGAGGASPVWCERLSCLLLVSHRSKDHRKPQRRFLCCVVAVVALQPPASSKIWTQFGPEQQGVSNVQGPSHRSFQEQAWWNLLPHNFRSAVADGSLDMVAPF